MKKGKKASVDEAEPAAAAFPAWRDALLLFCGCFVVYTINVRTVPISAGADTIPNRLIPFSLLLQGTPTLDPFRQELAAAGVNTWYARKRAGSLVSLYPIGVSLAALPVYVPVFALVSLGGWPSPGLLFALSEPLEKLTAALLASVSVVLFYLCARRFVSRRTACGAAVVLGLGTCMWSVASQMLWQHTVVALCVAAAMYFLTWPELPSWASGVSGAVLSLAVATRPTAALLMAAGLAVVASTEGAPIDRGRRVAAFVIAAFPLIVLSVAINVHYYNSPGGFYGFRARKMMANSPLSLSQMKGALGLLVSPNRGLIVYTPIAVLGLIGLVRRRFFTDTVHGKVITAFGAAALAHLLITGLYPVWWGGWSFGPRYLVDVIPILGIAALEPWQRLGRFGRTIAAFAIAWGLIVQVNGAFCYPASRWDERMIDPEQAVWSLRDFELAQDFRAWLESGSWSTPF
jgi:hypothetical protein